MKPYLTCVKEEYLNLKMFKSGIIKFPKRSAFLNARPSSSDNSMFLDETDWCISEYDYDHYLDCDITDEFPRTTKGTLYNKSNFGNLFLPVWHFQSTDDITKQFNTKNKYYTKNIPFVLNNSNTIFSDDLAFIDVYQPSHIAASKNTSQELTELISSGKLKPIPDWTHSTNHFIVKNHRYSYYIEKNKHFLLNGTVYLRLKRNDIYYEIYGRTEFEDGENYIFIPIKKGKMVFERYNDEILGISGDFDSGIYHKNINSFLTDYYAPEFTQGQQTMADLENRGLLKGSYKTLHSNIQDEIDWYSEWSKLVTERNALEHKRDQLVAYIQRTYNNRIAEVDAKMGGLYHGATRGGHDENAR